MSMQDMVLTAKLLDDLEFARTTYGLAEGLTNKAVPMNLRNSMAHVMVDSLVPENMEGHPIPTIADIFVRAENMVAVGNAFVVMDGKLCIASFLGPDNEQVFSVAQMTPAMRANIMPKVTELWDKYQCEPTAETNAALNKIMEANKS